jgi:hypothetical protein
MALPGDAIVRLSNGRVLVVSAADFAASYKPA